MRRWFFFVVWCTFALIFLALFQRNWKFWTYSTCLVSAVDRMRWYFSHKLVLNVQDILTIFFMSVKRTHTKARLKLFSNSTFYRNARSRGHIKRRKVQKNTCSAFEFMLGDLKRCVYNYHIVWCPKSKILSSYTTYLHIFSQFKTTLPCDIFFRISPYFIFSPFHF